MPIIEKCKKGSLGASAVAAFETILHRVMKISSMVDIFITPSEFLREKLIEYGFNKDKIICLNNFIDLDLSEKSESADYYYLFVGRLEREKGIKTLIDAAMKADAGMLKIVGDGTLREELEAYVREVNGDRIIEFLGHRSNAEVIKLVQTSRFVVIPSEWYENFPFAVLEAFACGKAVIGSRVGGIPELVRDNETGLTFEMGDSDDLSSKIRVLLEAPERAEEMGSRARSFVTKDLNAENHYQRLMEIYSIAMK